MFLQSRSRSIIGATIVGVALLLSGIMMLGTWIGFWTLVLIGASLGLIASGIYVLFGIVRRGLMEQNFPTPSLPPPSVATPPQTARTLSV